MKLRSVSSPKATTSAYSREICFPDSGRTLLWRGKHFHSAVFSRERSPRFSGSEKPPPPRRNTNHSGPWTLVEPLKSSSPTAHPWGKASLDNKFAVAGGTFCVALHAEVGIQCCLVMSLWGAESHLFLQKPL